MLSGMMRPVFMTRFLQIFNQLSWVLRWCFPHRIQLNTVCSLRCLDCRWWDNVNANTLNVDLVKQLDSSVYQSDRWRGRVVHVFGGDPICDSNFNILIMQLYRSGARIRLWTTGIFNADLMGALMPILDQLYIYVPSGDPIQYQHIVGTCGWESLDQKLNILSDYSSKVWINYEARSDTIQYLPELYEFTIAHRFRLLIQCDQNRFIDPESIQFIKRFYRVKHASIYFTAKSPFFSLFSRRPSLVFGPHQRCSGISHAVTHSWIQHFKNGLFEFWANRF
jgi:hypothetical protein